MADEIAALGDLEADYMSGNCTLLSPAASQAGILEHYMTIAKKSPVPLIVYNIPSTTHNYIEPETINKLIAVKNIAESQRFIRKFYRDYHKGDYLRNPE
ncbi:MAG: dihydrodipicolinate synthase family protein [Blautia sp.]